MHFLYVSWIFTSLKRNLYLVCWVKRKQKKTLPRISIVCKVCTQYINLTAHVKTKQNHNKLWNHFSVYLVFFFAARLFSFASDGHKTFLEVYCRRNRYLRCSIYLDFFEQGHLEIHILFLFIAILSFIQALFDAKQTLQWTNLALVS